MKKPRLKRIRLGKMHKRGLTGLFFFDTTKTTEQHESASLQQPFIQNKFLGGVCADSQGNQRAVQQHP